MITINYYNYKNDPIETFTLVYPGIRQEVNVSDLYSFANKSLCGRIPEDCYIYVGTSMCVWTRIKKKELGTMVRPGSIVNLLVCDPSFNHRWGILCKRDTLGVPQEKILFFDSEKDMIYEFNEIVRVKPPTIREIIAGQYDVLSVPAKLIKVYDIWANNAIALDECRARIEKRTPNLIRCQPSRIAEHTTVNTDRQRSYKTRSQ